MTATAKLNEKKYAKLLAKALPGVIETEEENNRLLVQVDHLMDKERLSPEESKLLDLLVKLIEEFEEKRYALNASTPHSILLDIMETRGIKQSDLWPLFGSKGTASEVINGKRGISKTHAKKLAEYFNVSVELFI